VRCDRWQVCAGACSQDRRADYEKEDDGGLIVALVLRVAVLNVKRATQLRVAPARGYSLHGLASDGTDLTALAVHEL
jgi:hypothetical protein